MLLSKLRSQNLIHPPRWLPDNTAYMTVMGSNAYGVSSDSSDLDIYGFCLPLKELVFPHLAGQIDGFGEQINKFEVWQEHHVKAPDKTVEYDFSIYSIIKYFQLCMKNNPNMIDSLFVPRRCIIHSTSVGEMVREARKSFLHKGAWHTFKGYAYAQMSKIRQKVKKEEFEKDYMSQLEFEFMNEDVTYIEAKPLSQRRLDVLKHGYDVKFAYHVVRLMNEAEQILVEGDLDLERNNEQLKTIRKGEWTLDDIEAYFVSKEKNLETAYANCQLPHKPDEKTIKNLLLSCLEQHYGSLSQAISIKTNEREVLEQIQKLLMNNGIV